MMGKKVILLSLLAIASFLPAAELPFGRFSLEKESGTIRLDEVTMYGRWAAQGGWARNVAQSRLSFTPNADSPKTDSKKISLSGVWDLGDGDKLDLNETISKKSDGKYYVRWAASADTVVPTHYLGVEIRLPATKFLGRDITVDGQALNLSPPEEKTRILLQCQDGKEKHVVSFISDNEKISITARAEIEVISVRKLPNDAHDFYVMRFSTKQVRGNVSDTSLTMAVRFEPIPFDTVDIAQAANSAFADEEDGDRQGGWTDQGKTRDLRSIPAGRMEAAGVPFKILDGAKNNGKGAIILRGKERSYFPDVATIASVRGKRYRRLYLLHATAWSQGDLAGTIVARYADGTEQNIPVKLFEDVRDWTDGGDGKNVTIGWIGSAEAFPRVYLYRSSFRLEPKPLREIVLKSAGGPVWMIAAVTASTSDEIPVGSSAAAKKRTVTYRPSSRWIAIDWDPVGVKEGTALDFSRFIPAPAGRFGEIVIRDGKFQFKDHPEIPVRFFGTNFSFGASVMPHEQAELVADRLAKEGCNLVRIHLYEEFLLKENGCPEFDPDKRDKLDYFIACLRKRGIYYVMTIYSGGRFPAGRFKDAPGYDKEDFRFQFKAIVHYSKEAQQYFRDCAKNLLTPVNPYTGVAPKDDPALLSVELTNENPVHRMLFEYPISAPMFRKMCAKYLDEKFDRKPSSHEVELGMQEFLLTLQEKFYFTMRDYLRNELGIKKPISDINCRTSLGFAMARSKLDYVDVHDYFDLYKFVGSQFGGNMFSHLEKNGGKKKVAALRGLRPIRDSYLEMQIGAVPRIFGKPFAVGEFNMCWPHPDRSMAVPLESALAAFQDWQMILHYSYAHKPEMTVKPHREQRLNNATSPVFVYSDRIGTMFLTRGDIAPSRLKIPLVLTRKYLLERLKRTAIIAPPDSYAKLGYICQIGTVVVDENTKLDEYPCVVYPADMKELPPQVLAKPHFPADSKLLGNLLPFLPEGNTATCRHSATGEMTFDAGRGTFVASSPRSEAVILSAGVKKANGKFMKITGDGDNAVCFAAALDDRPLTESKRIVFLYITDGKDTGTVIAPEGHNGYPVCLEEGDLPHLLRQGTVTVELPKRDTKPQVHALHWNGEKAVAVPVDGSTFEAKAVTNKDVWFAYEINYEQ